jgi:enediyne biosynthesis protein E3
LGLENDPKQVCKEIELSVDEKLQGFSFEGASMAFVILDFLNPWKNFFNKFLKEGNKHEYMLYVGAGWAVARLPLKRFVISKLNKENILHSLVFDGIGFHQGYFYWKDSIFKKQMPKYLKKEDHNSYFQGLGRSMWFVFGGNSKKILEAINIFDENFKGDLWSGIGLASTYAGGRQDSIKDLKKLSGKYFPDLCQGSSFAAKARHRAGNITLHNRYVCSIYSEMSIEDLAKITDDTLLSLDEPKKYSLWRKKIREKFI